MKKISYFSLNPNLIRKDATSMLAACTTRTCCELFKTGTKTRGIPRRAFSVYYHPHYFAALPPGHSFPIEKYPLLYEILKERKIVRESEFVAPTGEVSAEDLELVHTKQYVDKVSPF